MLPLQKCRELLSSESANLTDSELDELRHGLYELAAVVLKAYSARTVMTPDQALGLLAASEREEAEERAAILEYDGGLSRPAAEQRAVAEVFKRRNGRPTRVVV